jgi:hypothetical protein
MQIFSIFKPPNGILEMQENLLSCLEWANLLAV